MFARVLVSREVVCGAFFMLFGTVALAIASKYSMGTASQMGPGYFPRLVSICLVALGAFGLLRAIVRRTYESIDAIGFRPLVIVLGSFAAFGLLLKPLGLVISGGGMLLISAFASRDFNIRVAVLTAVGVLTFAYVLFVYAIQMTLPIWPE